MATSKDLYLAAHGKGQKCGLRSAIRELTGTEPAEGLSIDQLFKELQSLKARKGGDATAPTIGSLAWMLSEWEKSLGSFVTSQDSLLRQLLCGIVKRLD